MRKRGFLGKNEMKRRIIEQIKEREKEKDRWAKE